MDGTTDWVWTSRLLLSRPTGWPRPTRTLQIGNVTFFQMSPKSHYQSHLHLSAQGQDCPGGNGETSVAAGDDPPALFLHAYSLVTGGFVSNRFPVAHSRLLSQLYKAGRRVMSARVLRWDGALMQNVFTGKNSMYPRHLHEASRPSCSSWTKGFCKLIHLQGSLPGLAGFLFRQVPAQCLWTLLGNSHEKIKRFNLLNAFVFCFF